MGADHDILLEKDSLFVEAGNAVSITKEALLAIRTLVSATSYDVFVSTRGYA